MQRGDRIIAWFGRNDEKFYKLGLYTLPSRFVDLERDIDTGRSQECIFS